MRRRTLFLAVVSAGVLSAAIVTSLAVGQGGIGGKEPPYKLTAIARQTESQATAEKLPRAPKPPLSPVVTPASCPKTHGTAGIYPYRPDGPSDMRGFLNYAVVTSKSDVDYLIFAGAPYDSPQQGLIRVSRSYLDPCAAATAGKKDLEQDYITRKGPLTITSVDGDAVVFSIAGGGTDRFNFVTGAFAHTIATPVRPTYP